MLPYCHPSGVLERFIHAVLTFLNHLSATIYSRLLPAPPDSPSPQDAERGLGGEGNKAFRNEYHWQLRISVIFRNQKQMLLAINGMPVNIHIFFGAIFVCIS
jgi:hypothetical protein